ncbi:winged helix DNA-binding domain-containing protein [Rubrivivax sp. RP6-9]|uniref:winged helix DNA-binding domain-containing protein n=1 Tax=Rubrivivax sp. RP6-9 TaxID=3415750 RepID=UPI003CC63E33
MTRPLASATPITPRALNRATLARQLLLARHRWSPLKALRHLMGLQAQAPEPPYLALLARLEGFEPAQLTRLLERTTVVRMAALRSTLHLIPADEALSLRGLLQPMMKRVLQASRGRLLDGLDLDVVAAAAQRLLRSQPLTHGQLGTALQRLWPERDADALATAARNLLPLAHLPPAGCWGCHARPQLEIHEAGAADHTLGVDALVLRYLQAFGPARPQDMALWCGLTQLGASFERLSPRLIRLVDEAGQEHFDLPRAPRPAPDTAAPPRLLGPWDALLLSYADRRRFLREVHRRSVFTNNGIVRPTAWVDGRVAGTWALLDGDKTARIEVSALEPLSQPDRSALTLEAQRLLHAVHPQKRHEIRIGRGDA